MTCVLGSIPTEARKWALFDLDWTITRPTPTQSRPTLKGGPFCLQADDWSVIPGRIERLFDFVREKYSIGIVTNQNFKGAALEGARKRIQNVYKSLQSYLTDIVILCSFDDKTLADPTNSNSLYRKPGIGWAYHLKFLPGSLYCGDACQDSSRPERSWGYSNSDRQFATNLNLPFYTPEEVFIQLPLVPGLYEVPQVVLLLVGPPGSGKSTFARNSGLTHIESDQFKSNWKSMQKAIRTALSRKERIVIDATNPTRERRLEIIAMATEYNAPVGIIVFLNSGKWNNIGRVPVGKMAYNMYWSRYEEPTSALEMNVQIYYQT